MKKEKYDIVVVGGGPAGVAAATVAAESAARVALVDENPAPGGQVWRSGVADVPPRARSWIERGRAAGVDFISDSTVVMVSQDHVVHAESAGTARTFCGKKLVLAVGSTEKYLPFPGWTLPGVMGVGALQSLVKSGWDVKGHRVVVAGSGPLLLEVALFLRSRGAVIVAIVEQAPVSGIRRFAFSLLRHPGKLRQACGFLLGLRGIPKYHGAWVERVDGTDSPESVLLRAGGRSITLDCDLLACAFGLVPETRLAATLGAQVADGSVVVDEFQRTTVDGVFCAGESTGVGGVDLALLEGQIAGLVAAGAVETARSLLGARNRAMSFAAGISRAFALREELKALGDDATIVCRCEDVSLGTLREYDDFREAKLRTRCGMGPCQSRICGPALEELMGWQSDFLRPPLFPTSMRALAEIGEHGTFVSNSGVGTLEVERND